MIKYYDDLVEGMAFSLEDYVRRIIEEFGYAIPEENKEFLWEHKDYREFFAQSNEKFYYPSYKDGFIYIPERTSKVFRMLKYTPFYGMKKSHDSYKCSDVLSDMSSLEYWGHLYSKGITFEQFCSESFPHEAILLCGGKSGEPFFDGLIELKAREVSIKNEIPFRKGRYNDEVKIATLVQDVLGDELMTKIAFCFDESEIEELVTDEYGEKTYHALVDLRENMNSAKKYLVQEKLRHNKFKYPDSLWKIKALEQAKKADTFIKKVEVPDRETIIEYRDTSNSRESINIDIDIA